jgi:hypothetical protein
VGAETAASSVQPEASPEPQLIKLGSRLAIGAHCCFSGIIISDLARSDDERPAGR